MAFYTKCQGNLCGHGTKPMVPFWDRCTTHVRTYFIGDWAILGHPWGLAKPKLHFLSVEAHPRVEVAGLLGGALRAGPQNIRNRLVFGGMNRLG